jgi:2-dehydropantoate 2-reductase
MIYIVGGGAVGLPLASYLTRAGRDVTVLRASPGSTNAGSIRLSVSDAGGQCIDATVKTGLLEECDALDGIFVIAAKTYANESIAAVLRQKDVRGPVVLMQNGIGIEQPFTRSKGTSVLRTVLYMTSQRISENHITFRQVAASPIGLVSGNRDDLVNCVEALSTPEFSFRAEPNIDGHVWKKVIVNAIFNTVCPLLDTDNGIFLRSAAAAELAIEIAAECVPLAHRFGVQITLEEIQTQVMAISRGSQGVLISTLQDIKAGRRTEIDAINLELARLAEQATPPLPLPRTKTLGQLVAMKSAL